MTALHWSDFEIEGELGSGRAGVVVLARLRRSVGRLNQGQAVAIKRYKSWVIDEPGQLERIFRELETGRKIIHPNLVNMVGIIADDVGRPALVMKHYEGESLQKMLERHRLENVPVDNDVALAVLGGLSGALGALHVNGVVHRDVKPANVLLTAQGPVLMDLGVVTSRDFGQMTTTPEFLGTIRYAAPEYLFGRQYDFRADVFSLGTMAYELLIGEQFDADVQHWAELVAKRFLDYGFSWNMAQRKTLTDRIGLTRLEFFLGILDHALVSSDKRTLALDSVEGAIKNRLFDAQFHFDGGKCLPGSPLFRPLGDFADGLGSLSIGDVVQEVQLRLTSDQLASLRTSLKEQYWGDWFPSNPAATEPLAKAGLVKTDYVTEFQTAVFHPAIRYAYRYGML